MFEIFHDLYKLVVMSCMQAGRVRLYALSPLVKVQIKIANYNVHSLSLISSFTYS